MIRASPVKWIQKMRSLDGIRSEFARPFDQSSKYRKSAITFGIGIITISNLFKMLALGSFSVWE